MDKNTKILSLLLFVVIALQGVSMLRKGNCGIPTRGAPGSYAQGQLFMDTRGEVVDPYSKRQVKNTVTANSRDIQKCFNGFVERNPSAPGKGTLLIDWMVTPAGKATNARVVFNELQDEKFADCIESAIESWSFPEPGYPTYAEHRFTFSKAPATPTK